MRDSVRIGHILHASDRIAELVVNGSVERLRTDEDYFLIVRGHLENIGEAAPKLSSRFRKRHPDLRYKALKDSRDDLVHEYFRVNYDLVWELMAADVPDLSARLRDALATDPTIQ